MTDTGDSSRHHGPGHGRRGTVRRRGGPARPIARLVGSITRPVFGRRGFADGAIVADWANVVGEHLAAVSAPEKVSYPHGQRRGGTLHLRIASGSIAVELQHLEPLLLERINGYFGYQAVERVRLIQAPLPERPGRRADPAPAVPAGPDVPDIPGLSDVDDPDLRAALERLGRAIATRKR